MKQQIGDRRRYFQKNKVFYILLIPGILYYLIFKYLPIYGISMAFQNFSPAKGFLGSPWIGFDHFKRLFASAEFYRVFKNTMIISFYKLAFAIPLPVILALLLNEIKESFFKKSVQTMLYLPRFLSWVVVSGIVLNLTRLDGGLINNIIESLGGEKIVFLADKRYFRGLLAISDAWMMTGWRTIIYMAALTNVDVGLYEAAKIDGANRWQQTLHITLPELKETFAIILVISVGDIMKIGFEQIIAMYNPAVYEVADILQTYVYRLGLQNAQYSYAAAVGIFNGVVALVLVLIVNKLTKKMGTRGMF